MSRLTIISAVCVLYSCLSPEEDVFDKHDRPGEIVVEGWVTDKDNQQYIKLSTTVSFASTLSSQPIVDAHVTVAENTDGLLKYYNYHHEKEGLYLSDSIFSGIKDSYYQAFITLGETDQVIISSSEKMNAVNPIANVSFGSFIRSSEENPDLELTFYYPIAWTSDPVDIKNYYRWKVYRNDTLFSLPRDIFLFDDRFIDGNPYYKQELTSYEFSLNDSLRLQRIEITEGAFEFLSQIKSQTTSLGTNSAVAPAAVYGNLMFQEPDDQTRVLGYFGTASISETRMIIR